MDTIFWGIDGTGVFDKQDYRGEMGSSFVSYLARRTPARLKKYVRGPGWDGMDISIIVEKAYTFVHLGVAAQPQSPVFLSGYSRGGAGVIGVAKRLASDGMKVRGMVLFDAVDRSLAIDSTEIPRNVERVVYARRDKLSMSRNSFGNSGTVWHAPTRCDMRSFFGTHGAMGGVPTKAPPGANSLDMIHEGLPERHPSNVSYAQDARAAREVWAWINPRLNSLGILGGNPLVQATV